MKDSVVVNLIQWPRFSKVILFLVLTLDRRELSGINQPVKSCPGGCFGFFIVHGTSLKFIAQAWTLEFTFGAPFRVAKHNRKTFLPYDTISPWRFYFDRGEMERCLESESSSWKELEDDYIGFAAGFCRLRSQNSGLSAENPVDQTLALYTRVIAAYTHCNQGAIISVRFLGAQGFSLLGVEEVVHQVEPQRRCPSPHIFKEPHYRPNYLRDPGTAPARHGQVWLSPGFRWNCLLRCVSQKYFIIWFKLILPSNATMASWKRIWKLAPQNKNMQPLFDYALTWSPLITTDGNQEEAPLSTPDAPPHNG
ncbi:predicted protein [Histoplasma capsulatum G186AR]|uniref:Uncharacterized protein n=1 Tax=Ajellomyces capsulatus (strain G186AR / H82 / ATCC MYA-2454 / RMSCC 2432) TaxID=447093 RepID=C0NNG3_AJECG|nr:uncharacterized protein HCBG_04290 [Histoplasma capsulatum G186AR]EEH07411.1 predicted protein [Histoplasma capsulatum G186AR]